MRDSTIAASYSPNYWYGHLPLNWNAGRLKQLFKVINGSTPQSSEADYWDGNITWVTPEDLSKLTVPYISQTKRKITWQGYQNCGTTLVPKDSIVITTRAPIGNLGVADASLCTNQGCKSLVSRNECYSKYYYYVLYAAKNILESRGNGTTFKELGNLELSTFEIPIPPPKVQKTIASFLDRKTAAIDTLIAKKQRLIQLLEEKRTALINQAVTKGLNPNAVMKDSGIPWIGEIPEHWEVRRISRIAQKITNGYVGPTRDILRDEGIPYIQSLHVKAGKILFERKPYYVEPEWSQIHTKSILKTDDILIVQTGAETGQCSIVTSEFEGANCHALIIVRTTNECSGKYLLYTLRSDYGNKALESIQTGALHEHLNCTLVKDVPVLIPPIDEQIQIVGEVDRRTSEIETLMSKTQISVQKLQEYRRSLITAAVTGKLDTTQKETP